MIAETQFTVEDFRKRIQAMSGCFVTVRLPDTSLTRNILLTVVRSSPSSYFNFPSAGTNGGAAVMEEQNECF